MSAPFAEDNDIVDVGLWIITQNQAEQCRFSGAVWSKQGPAFTGADGPVDVAQNCRSAVAHSHVAQTDQFFTGRMGILLAIFESACFADGNDGVCVLENFSKFLPG